jgi:hypothetical protein
MSSEIFEEDDTLKVQDETIEPKSKEFRIEGEEIEEEQVVAQDDFYANLAEELEDSVFKKRMGRWLYIWIRSFRI